MLQFECGEARYVLRPWALETFVSRKVSESDCSCTVQPMQLPDENLANDIDKAIQQVQKLREISNPKVSIKQKEKRPRKSEENESKTEEKKCEKPSSSKSGKIASKKQTNFIAANKYSVRVASLVNKKENKSGQVQDQEKRKLNLPKLEANVNKEINTLISKITELPSTRTKIKSQNCPVHNKHLPQVVEARVVRNVQVSQALREIEIPRTLGKVIKLRHSFWEPEDDSEQDNEKQARAEFRSFFRDMEEVEKEFIPEEFINLITESTMVFQESFRSDMSFIEKSQLGVQFTKTNTAMKSHVWKMRYKFKNYEQDSADFLSPKMGWISNGVWNISVIPFLKEMSQVSAIRYSDENQLRKFYLQLEEVQKLKYQKDLVEIITKLLHDSKITNASAENNLNLYKLSLAITQTVNLKTPVFSLKDH